MDDRGLGALAAALKAGGWEPGLNVCAACGHSGGRHDLGNWCLDCPRPDEWDHTAKSPTGAKVDAGWCYFASMTETEERTLGLAAILGERGVFLPEGLPIPADVGHRNAHDPDALLITEAELARAVLKACDHNGWGVYRTLAGGASWIDRRTVSAAILAEIREATDAV